MSKFDKVLIIELIVSMIMFIVVAVMLFSFSGYQLVTVQVHQRTIVDVGSDTKDNYTNEAIEEQKESNALTVAVAYKTSIQKN